MSSFNIVRIFFMTSFYGKSCTGCNTYICFQFHRICFLRFPLYPCCFYFGFFIKSVETISPLAILQAFCVVINITDVTRITGKKHTICMKIISFHFVSLPHPLWGRKGKNLGRIPL